MLTMKFKKYVVRLSDDDYLDVTLIWEEPGELTKFALNYRACIQGKWYEIYRVDNFHGFLHEQKFWRSSEPIPIIFKENWPLWEIIIEYRDDIIDNFRKYRDYFEKGL